jgi:hypothetical protein
MTVRTRAGLRRPRATTKTRRPARRDPVGSEAEEVEEVEPRMGTRPKWSGRDSLETWSRCAVEGCDAIAIATLRADQSSAPRAWLVDLERPSAGEDVCARHADALAASEGWTVHDVRATRARSVHSVDASRRSRPALDVTEEIAGIDLRRPGAPIGSDDALLDARSPLLRRAFAKSRDA